MESDPIIIEALSKRNASKAAYSETVMRLQGIITSSISS
jgi:hypothetical protein